MLSVRYLTQKLRTQSLNEEHGYSAKTHPDRDSGTESDDELPGAFTSETDMDVQMTPEYGRRNNGGRERTRSESGKENSSPMAASTCTGSWNQRDRSSRRRYLDSEEEFLQGAVNHPRSSSSSSTTLLGNKELRGDSSNRPESPLDTGFPPATDSALPSDNDHPWGDQHSSEEELDHINNGPAANNRYALHVLTPARMMLTSDGSLAEDQQRTEDRFRTSRRGSSAAATAPEEGRSTLTVISQPEKRKWSQVNPRKVKTPTSVIQRRVSVVSVRTRSASALQQRLSTAPRKHTDSSSASSDEEVQGLLLSISTNATPSPSAASVLYKGTASTPANGTAVPATETPSLSHDLSSALPIPVQFCTSPPEGAHKPHKLQDVGLVAHSVSPPPKLFHLAEDGTLTSLMGGGLHATQVTGVAGGERNSEQQSQLTVASPRKRYRHTGRVHHLQRPCLDFEKMQQMKTHSVTTWRHDGELSLFCW